MEKEFEAAEFRKFKVGNVFNKVEAKCKKTDFDKRCDTSTVPNEEYCVPLINAKVGDNGIMFYGRKSDWNTQKMCIDVIQNGAIATGTVYAQPQSVGVLWDAYLIKPVAEVESAEVLLYMAKCMEKITKERFSYDKKATWNRVKDCEISLPVTSDGDINFDYMERYIAELEAERIAELEAYLTATGLDDCDLTCEDEATLATDPLTADFKVGEILRVEQTKSVVAKKDLLEGDIPYITRSTSANGYTGTCGNSDRVNAGNCITIGAETAVAYYQPADFVAGNKVYRLSRDGLNERQYRYLVGSLNMLTHNYSYSNARIPGKIKVETISLPVIPSPDPSHVYTPDDIAWGYMERYIRAVEKLVMTDVIAYKDKVIATTRQIVSNSN